MAYHPRGYEVVYGFDTLDLFHNLFPEMLYDAEAFPDPTVRWMRDRIASLMPIPYSRQRTLYEVYSMAQRRDWLLQWRRQNIPLIPQNTHPIPQNTNYNHASTITAMPSTFTAMPSTFTAMPSTFTAMPSTFTAMPSTFTAMPSTFTAMPSTFTAIPSTVNASLVSTITAMPSTVNASLVSTITAMTSTINAMTSTITGMTSTVNASLVSTITGMTSTVNASLVSTIVGNASIHILDSHQNNLQNDDVGGEVIVPAVHVPRRRDLVSIVMSALLQQELAPQNGLNVRRTWEDVPVVAPNEIIDQGSRILREDQVASDSICSICQHYSEPETDASIWRSLYCGHQFHRTCIDRWFEENVVCPVCRADIRDSPPNE